MKNFVAVIILGGCTLFGLGIILPEHHMAALVPLAVPIAAISTALIKFIRS